jgi:hypothetical protein
MSSAEEELFYASAGVEAPDILRGASILTRLRKSSDVSTGPVTMRPPFDQRKHEQDTKLDECRSPPTTHDFDLRAMKGLVCCPYLHISRI